MSGCCISHEFLLSASRDPSRVVAVHATGGLRLFKESTLTIREASCPAPAGKYGECGTSATSFSDAGLDFSAARVSSNPPIFPGDECFTYGDLLSAVDSLSCRIRCVLDGGDDASLIRPQGYSHISHSDLEGKAAEQTGLPYMRYMPRIVGVQIGPSVEYIVAVLSILRCGEAFLPLDPFLPDERMMSIVSSSGIQLVIKLKTDSFLRFGSPQGDDDSSDQIVHKCGCSVLYCSMKDKFVKHVDHANLVWPCKMNRSRNFCYVMYTSGSTGKPKGVCGKESGLLNRYSWMQDQFPIFQEDILLFKTSVSFIDHLQEFLAPILTGCMLVIPPYTELKLYFAFTVHFIEAYGVSRLTTVPSLVREVLPCLAISPGAHLHNSLKLLVLSGEILSIALWQTLQDHLPETTILNLYGSTEVSGDCAYFDCRNLPSILKVEQISSVPIGKPMSNCEINLFCESKTQNEGELCIRGMCLLAGYLGKTLQGCPIMNDAEPLQFRTGDFARRLQSGDFLILGRKDRLIKIRGQRVPLEEVENLLKEHPKIRDAALIFQNDDGCQSHLQAFFVVKEPDNCLEGHANGHENGKLIESLRSWLVRKLPPAMLPTKYIHVEMLPKSASGKVDYLMLAGSTYVPKRLWPEYKRNISDCHHLEVIRKAFIDALHVEGIADDDDFFAVGGDSISAAHTAYNLGIDMRLLYVFPSPCKLLKALQDSKQNGDFFESYPGTVKRTKLDDNMLNSFEISENGLSNNSLPVEQVEEHARSCSHDLVKFDPWQSLMLPEKDEHLPFCDNHVKMLSYCQPCLCGEFSSCKVDHWLSRSNLPKTCAFSRCNQIVLGSESVLRLEHQTYTNFALSMSGKGHLQELWKVLLKSCVDASPLVIVKDGSVDLFIGSHSQIFLRIDVLRSGFVRWQVFLEGRIECSAAVTGDFSQVVVGSYKGYIYFLDYSTGSILWTFQTSGEVKMQPIVDVDRDLIWCGSHDHYLYALDYRRHCCMFKISCRGSIYGSPAIDTVRSMLYVATTSGLVNGLSLEVSSYGILWKYESRAPIFASLCLDSSSGNVYACSVDGFVIALNPSGHTVWKVRIGGPIFAGPTLSSSLPSQLLICSRSGYLCSIDMDNGAVLWDFRIGDPITASAYVDEQFCVVEKTSNRYHRLVCVCSSTGKVHVLQINPDAKPENAVGIIPANKLVDEFAVIQLPADIFSSPVMIGGRIFVGCRDDYVHCISLL
ncbi:Putative acyl-activating enzyme 19 [Apostasia shenzhenica]|uniref:4-coumarate--CoA ligase n=1 Tax=Apostasia shenzhenica TaxID=1088818 RepID=A0A2I0BEK7_9ASPA|nr:Putative acyl-activating enzyme 19 [Apostasia shenzhenica]